MRALLLAALVLTSVLVPQAPAQAVASCSVVAPVADAWVGGAPYLRASCTGATSARFEVRPDGSSDPWTLLGEVDEASLFAGIGDASALAHGSSWQLRVVGYDGETAGPPSTSRRVTVDKNPPFGQWQISPIALDGSAVVGEGTLTFHTASSDGSPQTALCRVRHASVPALTAPWSSCGPQQTGFAQWSLTWSTTGVSGVHYYEQVVTDAAGNSSVFTSIPFRVDVDPPVVAIGGPAPGALVATRDVELPFTVDEPATLTCRLERASTTPPGDFGPCTGGTGHSGTGLDDGAWLLTVRAVDALGNASETARAFVVDATPPAVAITGGPAPASVLRARSARFVFGSPDPEVSYECRLRRAGAATASYAACSGLGEHTVAGLADGSWTFTVRAQDGAGNAGTATRSFRVDATAPVTRVTSRPAKVVRTRARSVVVRFRLTANEPVTHRCRLDKGAWRSCTSARRWRVARGRHVMRVVAVDRAGNADRTPVVVRWRVIPR